MVDIEYQAVYIFGRVLNGYPKGRNMREGIIKMGSDDRLEVLTRKELYDEVWELSVAGVARKYDVKYSKLLAECKKERIPIPSSGYWYRKNFDKDVSGDIVELQGDPNKEIKIGNLRGNTIESAKQDQNRTDESQKSEDSAIVKEADEEAAEDNKDSLKQSNDVIDNRTDLLFLDDDERNRVLQEAMNISVDERARLHETLIQYKRELEEYRREYKKLQRKHDDYYLRYNKPKNKPEKLSQISEESTKRALAIMNTLMRSIERLGGKVNGDLSVQIKDDVVSFDIVESQKKIPHELTKKEAERLAEYNDKIKHDYYVTKPNIRKHDYIYSGNLRVVICNDPCIKDSKNKRVEDMLGDALICLYEAAEEKRIARIKREEEQRIRQEEEQKKEELRKRKAAEIEHLDELVNCVEDYRTANEIRAYVKAMIMAGREQPDSEWVKWAERKADWLDPIVTYEDELLGIREHGKSKEDKDKQLRDSVRKTYSWY